MDVALYCMQRDQLYSPEQIYILRYFETLLLKHSLQAFNGNSVPCPLQKDFNISIIELNRRVRYFATRINRKYLDLAKTVHKTSNHMWTCHYSYLEKGLFYNQTLCKKILHEVRKYLVKNNI